MAGGAVLRRGGGRFLRTVWGGGQAPVRRGACFRLASAPSGDFPKQKFQKTRPDPFLPFLVSRGAGKLAADGPEVVLGASRVVGVSESSLPRERASGSAQGAGGLDGVANEPASTPNAAMVRGSWESVSAEYLV
jgi:hypothetical protein